MSGLVVDNGCGGLAAGDQAEQTELVEMRRCVDGDISAATLITSPTDRASTPGVVTGG